MSDVQLACSGSEDVPPALGERLGRALRSGSHGGGGGGGKRGSGNGSGSERGKRAGREEDRDEERHPGLYKPAAKGTFALHSREGPRSAGSKKRTWPGATRGSAQLSSAHTRTPGTTKKGIDYTFLATQPNGVWCPLWSSDQYCTFVLCLFTCTRNRNRSLSWSSLRVYLSLLSASPALPLHLSYSNGGSRAAHSFRCGRGPGVVYRHRNLLQGLQHILACLFHELVDMSTRKTFCRDRR